MMYNLKINLLLGENIMSKGKIKGIKVIRLLLFSFSLYYSFNREEFNSDLRVSYILVDTMLFLCGLTLVLILPEEYQAGNTFLKTKYRWLEIGIEIVLMFLITWILCQF